MVCSVVGAAITISNDTMQDLKAGQIVGATPWKQQVMLIVGVVVAAFVIAPVLELLFNAYGMGGIFPHPGMPRADMLAAPQAGLMAAVLQGVFAHKLAWAMLISGGVIAVIAICIDEWLKPRGLRLPVLAIGLGIYLPLNSSMPIVVGGFISYFATRAVKKRIGAKRFSTDKAVRKQLHRTLLAACGIVAGASIMGVILAIPFAIARNANVLSIVGPNFVDYANVLGFAASVWVCWWLFRTVTKKAS
jgi:putative OPT family oligopeptide transporter